MGGNLLYIIGNGFDLYHGVPTRFSQFKEYLRATGISLHDVVERFIPLRYDPVDPSRNWSDLEEGLAGIDGDEIVDYAFQFLMSYGDENWSDAGHHDYQYEVDKIVADLSAGLKLRFAEWVRQVEVPGQDEVPDFLPIDSTARFLNFNYTNTLSALYGVPQSNITFIHGEAACDGDEIVLGHAWNPINIPSLNNVSDPESLDTRVMEGNEIINEYFGKTFKNTSNIIQANNDFFLEALKDISAVCVLGHSLSDVDLQYFRAIIENINHSVHWYVSFHFYDQLASHRRAMEDLGVSSAQIHLMKMESLRWYAEVGGGYGRVVT
jgi:hypothetical protein